ncbi:hypothetical protein [Gottfriedia acidiceleris]|uniref:hypothetical protein n=1 Tax=Gottfriedia acidiceleris TaxID=371036 RepID=UPI002FFFFB12
MPLILEELNKIAELVEKDKYIDFVKKISSKIKALEHRKLFDKLKKHIKNQFKVTLLISSFEPKIIKMNNDKKSKLKIFIENEGNKKVEAVSSLSPYLETLCQTSQKDQFIHMFIVGENIKDMEDIKERIKYQIIDFIINYDIDSSL